MRVYNGEIYNAMEHYTSDGECIIPKYLQHGFYFPNMLDGEFAICLVDYANERIVLSSDVFAPNLFGMPSMETRLV